MHGIDVQLARSVYKDTIISNIFDMVQGIAKVVAKCDLSLHDDKLVCFNW